jgi:exodeoxyribonuclease-5
MAALPALSPDQTAAWDAAATVLARAGVDLHGSLDPADPDRVPAILAITGRAGSGKSLLLAQLTKALREAGVEIVSPDWDYRRKKDRRTLAILAPTNKAAAVLRAKGVPATTIHRILYTPVYDPEFERVAAWLAGEGDRPAAGQLTDLQLDRARAGLRAARLGPRLPRRRAACAARTSSPAGSGARSPWTSGLVDEASMLRRSVSSPPPGDLSDALLLFGDPAQLPPVQGQGTAGGMVFEKLPPERVKTLTAVPQAGGRQPILDLAHALVGSCAGVDASRPWCARPQPATARGGHGPRGQRPDGPLAGAGVAQRHAHQAHPRLRTAHAAP